jgi:hypothetical protein
MEIRHQNSSPSNDELIISTEDGKTMRQLYAWLCVGSAVFGFFILISWLAEDPRMTNTFRCFSSIFWSGMLLLALYSSIPRYRGTWCIGPEEIKFTPLHGPPVSLRWDEVRRVKWVRNRIVLEGDKEKIGIAKYDSIFEKQFKQARERIQRALSPYFDLTMKPLYKTKDRPEFIAALISAVRIIVLAAVGFALLMIGFIIILHFRDKLACKSRLIAFIWMLSLFCIPVALKTIIDTRKHRKLNPVWRERLKDVEKSETET